MGDGRRRVESGQDRQLGATDRLAMKDADDEPMVRIRLDPLEEAAAVGLEVIGLAVSPEDVVAQQFDNGRQVGGDRIAELDHVGVGDAHRSRTVAGGTARDGSTAK
ncbi:MAG: hypothetical protein R2710_09220 [Acidimicrobiales bacterium]